MCTSQRPGIRYPPLRSITGASPALPASPLGRMARMRPSSISTAVSGCTLGSTQSIRFAWERIVFMTAYSGCSLRYLVQTAAPKRRSVLPTSGACWSSEQTAGIGANLRLSAKQADLREARSNLRFNPEADVPPLQSSALRPNNPHTSNRGAVAGRDRVCKSARSRSLSMHHRDPQDRNARGTRPPRAEQTLYLVPAQHDAVVVGRTRSHGCQLSSLRPALA